PGCRAITPAVGVISPVMRWKSVVLPMPFRPTMPQRSPAATVNVMSRKSVVAPNSTAVPEMEICVTTGPAPLGVNPPSSRVRQPGFPFRFGSPDAQPVLLAHERHAKQQRFIHEPFEPALVGKSGSTEPKVGIAPGPGVHERGDTESLRKARELPA